VRNKKRDTINVEGTSNTTMVVMANSENFRNSVLLNTLSRTFTEIKFRKGEVKIRIPVKRESLFNVLSLAQENIFLMIFLFSISYL
jgi:hypothetical protein